MAVQYTELDSNESAVNEFSNAWRIAMTTTLSQTLFSNE